jgi:hypothetical protein
MSLSSRGKLSRNLVNVDTVTGFPRFVIEAVRPGKYTITVNQRSFRSQQAEYLVNVTPGRCAAVYASMSLDGKVTGRLRVSNGDSPPPIKLQLIPVLQSDRVLTPVDTLSRDDGSYEFYGVPPGRYLLGINALDEPTAETPFKRIYYPGVTQRKDAVALQLGEAQTISKADFTLPPKLHPRTIKAQVTWPDGSPARSVHTWCSPSGYLPWQHVLTDANGQITFNAMDGLPYEVGAAAASNYDIVSRRRFTAKPVRVAPGTSTSISLILSIPPP